MMCDCIEKLKESGLDFTKHLAELTNVKTMQPSGYGIRVIEQKKTKNGNGRRRKTFIVMNYCPFCGEKQESE